jgi:hypothetical protein
MTASVVLDRALKEYNGRDNTMRSAGAKELIGIAKKHNIRVDNKPSVGAMFLTLQGGNPNKRHAGIVWKVENNNKSIQTIEGNAWSGSAMQIGNSGCAVDANNKEGIISRKISVGKVKEFLHIEELEGKQINEYSDTPAMLADEGDICLLDSELALDADGGSSGDTDKTENYNADDYICGIPKEYIHIGGSVIILGLFCVLMKKLGSNMLLTNAIITEASNG